MRFARLAFLGVLSLCAGAGAACSSGNVTEASGSTSGAGGGVAGTTATTTTSTGTTSSGGGPLDAGPDADFGMPSNTYPAPHDPPAQVSFNNGPVLASPVIVPVFFGGDDPTVATSYAGQLADFDAKIGGTQYWTATTSEYGVGAATAAKPVALTETAGANLLDTDIQTWLAGKLNANDSAFPTPTPGSVYVLHYPATTTITFSGTTQASCSYFGGYHDSINLDGAHDGIAVAYAVIPRCATLGALNGIDGTTDAESHELVEAATDPYPMMSPAYTNVDNGHFIWERTAGGPELGDMCQGFSSSDFKFPELPLYTVQRTWSNKAALAGHDPCQPSLPGEVYFAATPVLTDTLTMTSGMQSLVTRGVKIPVGSTRTIDIDLFSDAPTSGPFTVTAQDLAAFHGSTSPSLSVTLDKDTGVNGDKVHATITVLKKPTKGNTETLIVQAKLGTAVHSWFGVIGN